MLFFFLFFFLFAGFRRKEPGIQIKVRCLKGIMEVVYPEYIYSPESRTFLKLDAESTPKPRSRTRSVLDSKEIYAQPRVPARGPPRVELLHSSNSLKLVTAIQ